MTRYLPKGSTWSKLSGRNGQIAVAHILPFRSRSRPSSSPSWSCESRGRTRGPPCICLTACQTAKGRARLAEQRGLLPNIIRYSFRNITDTRWKKGIRHAMPTRSKNAYARNVPDRWRIRCVGAQRCFLLRVPIRYCMPVLPRTRTRIPPEPPGHHRPARPSVFKQLNT